MKLLISLLLLTSCISPTSKDKAKRVKSSNADCITETGKHSDLTFCVDGHAFIVCNNEECLVYAPH